MNQGAMDSYFSVGHTGNYVSQESGKVAEDGKNFSGDLMPSKDDSKRKSRKFSFSKVSPLSALSVIIIFCGTLILSEMKWGTLSRVKQRIIGYRNLKKFQKIAQEFRDEVIRWDKVHYPTRDIASYLQDVKSENHDMEDVYHTAFINSASYPEDGEKKKHIWNKYVKPYLEVGDVSVLKDCVTEFLLFREFIARNGYKINEEDDEEDWKIFNEFNVSDFQNFAKQIISDGKHKDIEETMQFYLDNVQGLLNARQKYLDMRKELLEWLNNEHDELITHHPDIEYTKPDEKQGHSEEYDSRESESSQSDGEELS